MRARKTKNKTENGNPQRVTRGATLLEKDLKTYQKKLPELLAHEGQFVLIHEGEVAGFFDTYPDAVQAGYERFELRPFLVKQVRAVEQVQFLLVDPWPI